MTTTPYLKSQADILADIQVLMRDPTPTRWTAIETYYALNMALDVWWDRVMIEDVYTVTGGWVSGTYEYTLPSYITEPVRPQVKRSRPVYPDIQIDDTYTTTWIDLPGYQVIPDGSGGLELKLLIIPYNLDGQILWWTENGHVPTTLATVSTQIEAVDTSAVIVGELDVGESGWVKIGAEWIRYRGLTRAAATTTLNNLTRGVNGTTAAQHLAAANVEWGVAADTPSLWRQLYDQIMVHQHEYYLTDASAKERGHHERQISFYQKRADAYWESYVPSFSPKLVLTVRGIGAVD
jgi:hypothetical protein